MKVDVVSGSRLITSAEATSISDIANKAPLASPTFTGTVTLPSDTSIGTVSATELGYLDGVTQGIQAQINAKVNLNTLITPGTGTKVTYDAKGLILSSTNITTSDVSGLGTLATQSARFTLFVPLLVFSIGFVQSRKRFCLAYGLMGTFNLGKLGDLTRVQSPEDRKADRKTAIGILLQSAALAAVLTLALVAIPL